MKKNVEIIKRTNSLTPTAEILRQNRAFYGLTQAQCAALIHVTTNTWSQYERGLRQISAGLYELWLIKVNTVDK